MSCADSDEQRKQNTERYRSGHNEAVLKTVCPQGHMGSNPILSARRLSRLKKNSKEFFFCVNIIYFIDTGSGGGVGFGLCEDITHAVIDEEIITSPRRYHTITEAKNGEGAP